MEKFLSEEIYRLSVQSDGEDPKVIQNNVSTKQEKNISFDIHKIKKPQERKRPHSTKVKNNFI